MEEEYNQAGVLTEGQQAALDAMEAAITNAQVVADIQNQVIDAEYKLCKQKFKMSENFNSWRQQEKQQNEGSSPGAGLLVADEGIKELLNDQDAVDELTEKFGKMGVPLEVAKMSLIGFGAELENLAQMVSDGCFRRRRCIID